MDVRKYVSLGLVVAVTALLVLALPQMSLAVNLLTNGDFEQGIVRIDNKTTGGGLGWTYECFMGAATIVSEKFRHDTGQEWSVHSGLDAMRVRANPAPALIYVYQDVDLTPNTNHTASAWFRTGGTFGNPGDFTGIEIWTLVNGDWDTLIAQTSTTALSDWQELTCSFTTGDDPMSIRYCLVCSLAQNYAYEFVTYDDASLDGSLTTSTLHGTVMSDGSALGGATVTMQPPVGGQLVATTEPDGTYTIANAPINANPAEVRVTKDGYYPETRSTVITSEENILDFDVDAVGQNILTAPGFDDGWPAEGWVSVIEGTGWVRKGSIIASYGHPVWFESGHECAEISSYGGNGAASISQLASVLPEAFYTASTWFAHFGDLWGVDSAQTAGLVIKEYDKWNDLVLEHPVVSVTDFTEPSQRLMRGFTTSAQTAYVSVGGRAFLVEDYTAAAARALFDTFALNGPKGPGKPSVMGKISSNGTALVGAKVNIQPIVDSGSTAASDADGYYALTYATTTDNKTVRAYKANYYPQSFQRKISQGMRVDFDLVPIGDNILINAGFDDYWSNGGWVISDRTGGCIIRAASTTATMAVAIADPTLIWYASGEEAVEIAAGQAAGGQGGGRIHQTRAVLPGMQYTASVMFRGFGTSWGVDPAQVAALFVEEYDSSDVLVTAHPMKYADDFTQPQKLSFGFTTDSRTAKVRIGAYAYLVDIYNNTCFRAVFDSFELNGPIAGGTSIADVKSANSGDPVGTHGNVVSAVYDGFFYVESPDRSSGIRVDYPAPAVGSVVNLRGNLSTASGEPAIVPTYISIVGTGQILPLGTTIKNTTNGLSTLGLYVKLWGKVSGSGSTFTIDDGSGTPIRVNGPAGYSANAGDYVLVEGALGSDADGSVLRAVSVTKLN